jgi:hypothetical protein
MLAGQRDFAFGKSRHAWDEQLIEDEVKWFREFCGESNRSPSIKVVSAFGTSQITVSDGSHEIALSITKNGLQKLIEELQTVLELADDESA